MNGDQHQVFLVDDDESVRQALTRLLRASGHRVQAFASAREFLESGADGSIPACLLLDVSMPGLDGLDLQRELQARDVALPVVFITGHGDIPMSVKAMKAGAVNFLAKPVRDSELLAAIDEALARSMREHAERRELDELRRRADTLTPREREVMARVVAGRLNKQIADDLGTSEKTVKVHRGRVMAKMKAGSLAQLVRAAERIGFTEKP